MFRNIATVCAVVLSVLLTIAVFPAQARQLRVIASVPPIHSLVAAVMQGTGEPELLVAGNQSPHDFVLKPSQASQLQGGDLIFWVGPQLEAFLEKPLATIASNARSVALIESPKLDLITVEEEDEHDHDHGHDHGGGTDPHIWLDPANAHYMVDVIASELTRADPQNAVYYRSNAADLQRLLLRLRVEIKSEMSSLTGAKYVVFHNAYQYFERRFHLHSSGIIRSGPQQTFSAARIRELRKTIVDQNITCIFSEPQFDPKIIDTLTEGLNVNAASLDPLGQNQKPGPDLYIEMMMGLVRAMQECLQER